MSLILWKRKRTSNSGHAEFGFDAVGTGYVVPQEISGGADFGFGAQGSGSFVPPQPPTPAPPRIGTRRRVHFRTEPFPIIGSGGASFPALQARGSGSAKPPVFSGLGRAELPALEAQGSGTFVPPAISGRGGAVWLELDALGSGFWRPPAPPPALPPAEVLLPPQLAEEEEQALLSYAMQPQRPRRRSRGLDAEWQALQAEDEELLLLLLESL